MAVLAGTDGKVTFSGGYTTKVNGWSVDFGAAALDITGWDDYDSVNDELWREKIGGIKEWAGSYTAKVDETQDITAKLGGAASTIEFELDEDDAANAYISGSVIVTGVSSSNSMEGVAEVTITFEGSGAPTLTVGS